MLSPEQFRRLMSGLPGAWNVRITDGSNIAGLDLLSKGDVTRIAMALRRINPRCRIDVWIDPDMNEVPSMSTRERSSLGRRVTKEPFR